MIEDASPFLREALQGLQDPQSLEEGASWKSDRANCGALAAAKGNYLLPDHHKASHKNAL